MARRKAAALQNTGGEPAIEGVEELARPRGRPRLAIDNDAVADAVAELFAEQGLDAVSIPNVADKLEISRATLYRTVPTKEDLLGILFERSTQELTENALAIQASGRSVRERLHDLIGLHVEAAVRMRQYMPVFFGGAGFAPDVYQRWHSWSREYEALWEECVEEAMGKRVLMKANAVATTRLILGMCIWVSRWYRPGEGIAIEDINEAAIRLLPVGSQSVKGRHRIDPAPPASGSARTRRSPRTPRSADAR